MGYMGDMLYATGVAAPRLSRALTLVNDKFCGEMNAIKIASSETIGAATLVVDGVLYEVYYATKVASPIVFGAVTFVADGVRKEFKEYYNPELILYTILPGGMSL